jgi:imidazole glycerol-phosphate synthase subunit HisH
VQPLVAVLDYGIGNLRSAQKSLERIGADARLTADRGLVADADAVVLPGVGNFGRCMEALRDARLDDVALAAIEDGRPFLGICVGMQMLFDASEECPGAVGLGVIPGTVRWLPEGVKRPQMQWNVLEPTRPGSLFASTEDRPWVYFLHSFHAAPDDPDTVAATCDYGGAVVAAVERGNVAAVQFHPEKSAGAGLGLLARWTATIAVPA